MFFIIGERRTIISYCSISSSYVYMCVCVCVRDMYACYLSNFPSLINSWESLSLFLTAV